MVNVDVNSSFSKGQQIIQMVAHEEATLAILVQFVGLFLIISSTVMFIKHESLQRVEHIFQMNILFCSTVFLLVDWILVLPGTFVCETFSFMFLIFGSASTFSAVGIAMARFRKMMRLSHPFSYRTFCMIKIIMVWSACLLLMIYPVSRKVVSRSSSQEMTGWKAIGCRKELDHQHSENTVCFFKMSILYINPVTSLCFAIGGVFFPLCLMIFCYIKIFQHLRKARLSAWLSHVAIQRSQQTQVIRCKGRKANVFQVTSGHPDSANAERFNRVSHRREKSVFLKGLFAVGIIIVCWVPFTAVWVTMSLKGFQEEYLVYIRYLMINAKLAVLLDLSHYIVFNVKFRRLYLKSVFGPFTNFLRSLYTDAEENTSQIRSQTNTIARSNATEKNIFTIPDSTRTQLDPIREIQANNNLPPEIARKPRRKLSRPAKFIRQLRRQRSLPEKLTRKNIVEPFESTRCASPFK